MTLPYSDAIFVCAFPRECTEAFLEGHVRAFAFFGGVPRRISYDNSKIAVAKITGGRDRKVTDEFLRLKSHHLFEAHFCLVRRPNEKGHVETLVGFARRNFLVPVPAVHGGLEPLNADLEADCREDLRAAAAGQAGDQGRAARRGAGGAAAAAGRGVRGRPGRAAAASTRCRWSASTPTTTRCRPSTPTTGSRSSATVDTVRIVVGDRVVADPPPVLGPRAGLLRPGALPGPAGAQARGAGLRGARWRAGSCRSASASCGGGWRPSSAGRGRGSSSRSCGCWSGPSLRELTRAVERALELGVADADAVRLILEHRRERPVGLFCLDGRPHLKLVAVPAPDLSAYASLTAGVAP